MKITKFTSAPDAGEVTVLDGASWLLEMRRIEVRGSSGEFRSPAGESLLVVLGGTHDLYAGGGSWMRRGLRRAPLDDARGVAVFLPPNTPYRSENGDGALLVVSARQPELPEAESPREELSRKPLLPLAGSGKAYDPAAGGWKPQEAFLASPEAILPRRLVRLPTPSGARLDRVIGTDYKALGLCVDEALLAPGQCVSPPPPDTGRPDYPAEIAVYVETEGRAQIGDVEVHAASGPVVAHVDGVKAPRVHAEEGRAYVLFAYAGVKGSTATDAPPGAPSTSGPGSSRNISGR